MLRRLLRIVLYVVLGLLALLVVIIGLVMVGLNTQAGRNLAVRAINGLAGPAVHVTGLGGHFPADIKLQSVQLVDRQGVWLHAEQLELRWRPLALLHGAVHVTALTARELTALREPVSKGKSKGHSLPALPVTVDRLEIGTLHLAPTLAGEAVTLHVSAHGQIRGSAQGDVVLDARSPDGAASYHLAAALGSGNIDMKLRAVEPPDGLIGHYAGPQARGPLDATIALDGPEQNAALKFAAALGAAQVDGAGHLGLVRTHFADVVFTVPRLAPFADMAKVNVRGSTQLHLRVAQPAQGPATLALTGDVALRAAPAQLQKLLGPQTRLALRLSLLHGAVTLEKLQVSSPDFYAEASGETGGGNVSLHTEVRIDQVSALSPDIAGNVTARSTVTGTKQDFAVRTVVNGRIAARGQSSAAPFTVNLDVQHLPRAPVGTLTGSGMLDSAPLLLDASFSRQDDGAFQVKISGAKWRSLTAHADLRLTSSHLLPSGTAEFAIGNMRDFSAFVPMKLQGGVSGDFAYDGKQGVKLDLAAKRLVVDPALGVINGTLTAAGPLQALAVRLQLALADLEGHPAQLALAGALNVPAQSATLTRLSAGWHGVQAVLQGPAGIRTKPSFAVQNLRLGLNGGTVALNGAVWPRLNATASVQNLPLALINLFSPGLGAAGTLDANATVTGPLTAPAGQVTFHAGGLRMRQGAGAALPPARLSGSIRLAGTSAGLDVKLAAGSDIAFEVQGQAPFSLGGAMNLHAQGRMDLRLLNLILSAQGTEVHGEIGTDLTLTGTPKNPGATGTVTLSGGSVQNIGTGLNLTQIGATIEAHGRNLVLRNLTATAGHGTLGGHGTVGLEGKMPIDLTLTADHASPVVSDLVSATLNWHITIKGAVRGPMAMAGRIDIAKANINIPHGLPPSVANLPILNEGETPPPPSPPAPPIALDLNVRALSHIFIRGDGLFAELGGHIHLGGTLDAPNPQGRFTMIRGNFNLAGKSLQFTSGTIGFSGDGFMPTLDLVATASSAQVSDATLTVSGTAAKPVITLSSSPPLPSDEILAQLLFGVSTSDLTPFQAASLAAALAQISGVGGGLSNPLDKVRSALGLDELSLGGTGTGAPTLQAGRYVAPGVYVGATQSADGRSSAVDVQVNLYKGLKLDTSTGTSATSGNSSSVGLTYQFNY